MKSLTKSFIARAAIGLSIALAVGCSDNKPPTIEPANVSMTIKHGTSDGTPTLVATRIETAEVRVDAIDYDTRGIVLTGPRGEQEIFTVGPEVVNFDQIKKGDLVKARFTQKMAISVSKTGEPPQAVTVGTISLPEEGEKPGIMATRNGEITATVTAINHDTREISITGPRGNTFTFEVGKQVEGFENVQAGDQVLIKYAEAVEITVTGS